jgi:hypothetical protein
LIGSFWGAVRSGASFAAGSGASTCLPIEDSWTIMRTFNARYDGDLAIAEDPVAAPLV